MTNQDSEDPKLIHQTKTGKIIKQVSVYSLSSYISKVGTVGSRFLLMGFVGPFQMGIWSLATLAFDAARFINLGIPEGLTKEIPRLCGLKEFDRAGQIQTLALIAVIILTIPVCLAVVVYTIIKRDSYNDIFVHAFLLIAVLLMTQRISRVLFFSLQSYKNFSMASKLNIYTALIAIAGVTTLVPLWKLSGWVVTLIISSLFLSFVSWRALPKFKKIAPIKNLIPLIKGGCTLMLVDQMFLILRNIDRFVIAHMMGLNALGFYSLGLTASAGLNLFPQALRAVIFPYYQESHSQGWSKEEMFRAVIKPLLALTFSLPFVLMLAWKVCTWIVIHWMPSFIPAIASFKILLLGTFFFSLAAPLNSFLVSINKSKALHLSFLMIALLLFASEWLIARSGFGIVGIAIAGSIAYLGIFSIAFHLTTINFLPLVARVKYYFLIILVLCYTATILILTDHAFGDTLLSQCLTITLFFLGFIPLIVGLNTQTELIPILKSFIYSKRVKPSFKTSKDIKNPSDVE